VARQEDLIDMLPVRAKKAAVKTRYFHYLLLLRDGDIWLHQRRGKDIWRGLYEPFLIEADAPLDAAALVMQPAFAALHGAEVKPEFLGEQKQRLTHQLIHSRFFLMKLPAGFGLHEEGFWTPLPALSDYAFPRTLNTFFEKWLLLN
jgi:A/G-specific adenine glycosylase